MTLFLSESDVQSLLTMEDTLAAVEEVFRLQGSGTAVNRPRQRLRTARSRFQIMPASAPTIGVFGFKAYGGGPAGHMRVFLYDAETGAFLAIIESNFMGQMRTGAASGIATKYQSRPDSATVGIYGTGDQARTQLEAICAVRPIRRVLAFSRDSEHRLAFANEMSEKLEIEVQPVSKPEQACEGCDIVVTITNASRPVLLGDWIQSGTHVNAAGGNSLARAELDVAAVGKAAIVTTDSVEQARMESADLLEAVERGLLNWEQVLELGQVVSGRASGRTSADEITLFESHGLALWDIAAANVVFQRAIKRGMGRMLPI